MSEEKKPEFQVTQSQKTTETVCTLPSEIVELITIARDNKVGLAKVNEGMSKLLDSQVHIAGVLEELKPLRSLPEISDNLTKIVGQLIAPATADRTVKRDWPAIVLAGIMAVTVLLMIYKEASFKGSLSGFGAQGSFESGPQTQEKKTN